MSIAARTPKKTTRDVTHPCLSVLLLALLVGTTGLDHATQLEFTSELAAEVRQVLHELLDDLDQGFLGGDGSVGLDANEELRYVGMGDCRKSQYSTRQQKACDILL